MPRKQSIHDKTLKRVAKGYESKGWKVKAAHLPGYSKPRTIYGKRPDLIAQKGKKIRVVEVETKSSYRSDKPQRKAFKRYASKSKNIKLRTKIAKR